MKYALAFLLLAAMLMPLYADLFISEYIEGSSNNKALEIYNSGSVGVDLSHYAFGLAANGATSWTVNPLSGTIAPSDVWINCNAGSSTAIQAVSDSIGGTSTYYNGDDAVCLMYSADLTTWNAIDIIGVLGVDPGTGWDVAGTTLGTLNHTLVRKPGITTGTTDWAASAGTTADDSQWIVYDVDTFSYLGWHSTAGGNQPPAIASVTVTPQYPTPSDAVQITASVTDDTRSVASVVLTWGTDGTTYPNTINMSLSSGTTYIIDTNIPAQADGTTVYFVITATDDESETGEYSSSYNVATSSTVTIYQIQGQTADSPYAGQIVTTTGVVTAKDTYGYYLQDGTGAWNGIYVYHSANTVVLGDNVTVTALVQEYYNMTELSSVSATVVNSTGNTLPVATVIGTGAAAEAYEGVLVQLTNAVCTVVPNSYGEWQVDDGSGAVIIDDVIYAYTPTLGYTYSITGVLAYSYSTFRVYPRSEADVVQTGADTTPPYIVDVTATDATTVVVTFNEELDQDTAEDPFNYYISTARVSITSATLDGADPTIVTLVVSGMTVGSYTLEVNDVEDTHGNGCEEETFEFTYTESGGGDYLAFHGFDTGDTWGCTIYPDTYNVSGDVWAAVSSLSTITPYEGTYFWGMEDLNNPNGGGAFYHTLIFDAIDINSYTDVTLSFQYYTIGYDTSDELEYIVEYDNGTTWGTSTALTKNTAAWTEVSIAIPSGTPYVRLCIQAYQDGGTDYAGIDNVQLIGTPAGGVSNPTNFAAATASTSQINLSWNLNASSNNVLVAYNTSDTFGTPVDGTTYTAGQTLTGGGTVLLASNGTTYSHTGLAAGTQYWYKAWSYDATTAYSDGITSVSCRTWMSVPALSINEYMADNDNVVADLQGEFDDWLEIYNPTASAVDLAGYYLTDDLTQPTKWLIPSTNAALTTVPAGGYLLFWCDEDTGDGANHVGFALSAGGESLGLYGSDGYTSVDTLTFGAQATDVSEGRMPDGTDTWTTFTAPTPGLGNATPAICLLSPNGGESWMQGYTRQILFGYSAGITNVNIYLNSATRTTIATNAPVNGGVYEWAIPMDTPVGSYTISVADTDGSPLDVSNGTFNIITYVAIPDIIIDEVMQNPNVVLDSSGEWFEVYNNGSTAIDITGWIIYDLGGNIDTLDTSGGDLTIEPGEYFVFGNNSDSATNGGVTVNYQYVSSFALGNADDEIIILMADGLTEVDRVEWDGGTVWPDPTGASMMFVGGWTDDNNVGGSWQTATTAWTGSAGDFGTPGANNLGILNTPRNVLITMSGTDVVLAWDAVTDATTYHIYRGTDPDSLTLYTSTADTTYTDTGAGSATKYYYYITAE